MKPSLRTFVFSSNSKENIIRAHVAKMWAIGSLPKEYRHLANGRRYKASPGDLAFFWVTDEDACHPSRLMMPSIIREVPKNRKVDEEIWSGSWDFPFAIEPLCGTDVCLTHAQLKSGLTYKGNLSRYFNTHCSFVPVKMLPEDLMFVLQSLLTTKQLTDLLGKTFLGD